MKHFKLITYIIVFLFFLEFLSGYIQFHYTANKNTGSYELGIKKIYKKIIR